MKTEFRLCNLNKIEDKFHFVMECPFYRDIKITICQHYLITNMSLETINNLFHGQKELISNLSRYIFYAFEHRDEQVEEMTEN